MVLLLAAKSDRLEMVGWFGLVWLSEFEKCKRGRSGLAGGQEGAVVRQTVFGDALA
jgi:hypothetical protein